MQAIQWQLDDSKINADAKRIEFEEKLTSLDWEIPFKAHAGGDEEKIGTTASVVDDNNSTITNGANPNAVTAVDLKLIETKWIKQESGASDS